MWPGMFVSRKLSEKVNHIIEVCRRAPTGPFSSTLNEDSKGIIFYDFTFEIKVFELPAGMFDIIQNTNGRIIFGSQFFKLTFSRFVSGEI